FVLVGRVTFLRVPFMADAKGTPTVNNLSKNSSVVPYLRRNVNCNDSPVTMNDNVFIRSPPPRSRVSYPWLLNDAVLGYGDYSGYMAPRPPVYASIVRLSGESARPASYYAPQIALSRDSNILNCHERFRNWVTPRGNNMFVNHFDSVQEYLSRPRIRRTVCVGHGVSLPPLLEEDGSYGCVRSSSSSVIMGTQAISLASQKVNNIEKAERMKAFSKILEEKKNEEALGFRNRKKSEKADNTEDIPDQRKENGERASSSFQRENENPEIISGNLRTATAYNHETAIPVTLAQPRVRLSYVEPLQETAREISLLQKKKRSSWAAGERISRLSRDRSLINDDILPSNERWPQNQRSRALTRSSATPYPRTESCVNAPKCKKRLSWASCERRRFSWSPRSISADRLQETRRFSIAGGESRKPFIRMGTRSLMPISSPVPGTLVHVSGYGQSSHSTLSRMILGQQCFR
ncbi:hypothetical protein SK128_020227, partial [Halocaridina rubra]